MKFRHPSKEDHVMALVLHELSERKRFHFLLVKCGICLVCSFSVG